ncbi:MAG: mechanosensitive ion channel protein [Phycisphaeraceae bacterium]|nr:mechanosensitive ion channel protein [Phycisphaeraceae bacterium]
MVDFDRIWNTKLFHVGQDQSITVAQVTVALVVLIGGLLFSSIASRLVGRRLRRGRISEAAADVAQKVIFYTLLVAVVFTSLRLLHIPLTMFHFLGGAVAIGFGFGAQNIINNFISGWILIAERPVRIGDLIELEGNLGRVERIGARCARVRRTDGIDMLVPNSSLLENPVVNWTLVDHRIRTTVRVGVAYGSPTDQVAALIRQAVEEHDDVLPEPAPDVIFEDFGDSALVFDVYFWSNVDSEMELRRVRSAVRFRIDQLFREAGIVIAFPQRDVHLDTLMPLEVHVRRD